MVKKAKTPKPVKNKELSTQATRGKNKNLVTMLAITISTLVIGGLIFMSLSSALSTESYYVLSQDVQSKQQITVGMVSEQKTSKGTGPQNALSMDEIQRGVYARISLNKGEVVSQSVAGLPLDTDLGVPDDWSKTSFSINTENALGGTLTRGDFIDILVVDEESGARYVYNNLLLLEATFTSEMQEEGAANARVGEVVHYTVAMPAEDIAYFHSALNDYENVKVIGAPLNTQYGGRDTKGLDKAYKFGPGVGNKDLFEGADATFKPVIRDDKGRPVNEKNCVAGFIDPSSLCAENGFTSGTKPTEEGKAPETEVGTEKPADKPTEKPAS